MRLTNWDVISSVTNVTAVPNIPSYSLHVMKKKKLLLWGCVIKNAEKIFILYCSLSTAVLFVVVK
jgi:hypothetical protein